MREGVLRAYVQQVSIAQVMTVRRSVERRRRRSRRASFLSVGRGVGKRKEGMCVRKSRRKKPKVVMMDVGEKDVVDSEQRVYRRRRRRRRAGGKSGSANGERVVKHPARCPPRDVPGPYFLAYAATRRVCRVLFTMQPNLLD